MLLLDGKTYFITLNESYSLAIRSPYLNRINSLREVEPPIDVHRLSLALVRFNGDSKPTPGNRAITGRFPP